MAYIRKCLHCGVEAKNENELDPFVKHKDRKYGTRNECKECYAKVARHKRKENEASYKERELQRKYNISYDDYNDMLEEQEGCCAICNKHHTEFDKALSVDHNHTTNNVRGLLCQPCNLMIGNALEDVSILKNGIAYLKLYKGK